MPSTRQRTPLRKRNLRNGALLAVSEVVKLVNIPLAQDVSRHLKQVAVTLKPSVLQAPKTNDSNARELAKHVEGLLDVLNQAVQHLDGLGLSDDSVDMVAELCQLQIQLSSTYTELQDVQNTPYTTKFVSQTETRDRILRLKEELSRTIVDLTLRLLIIVLASSAQSQSMLVRRLDYVALDHNTLARSHNTLSRKHGALVRAQQRAQRRQRASDERIRSLTHEVNATLFKIEGQEHQTGHAVLPFSQPNVVTAPMNLSRSFVALMRDCPAEQSCDCPGYSCTHVGAQAPTHQLQTIQRQVQPKSHLVDS